MEAVRLAQAGLAAGENVLEGGSDSGLLHLLKGDASALLPEQWKGEMLDGIYFKPIPACRHAQPAVEALLDAFRSGPIPHGKVRKVVVLTYPVSIMFGKPPRPEHELYDRLMSTPWAVASCLVHGGYGFDNVLAPAFKAYAPAFRPDGTVLALGGWLPDAGGPSEAESVWTSSWSTSTATCPSPAPGCCSSGPAPTVSRPPRTGPRPAEPSAMRSSPGSAAG